VISVRLWIMAAWLGLVLMASAQSVAPTPDGRVEVDADRLEYDADRRLLVGTGNVVILQFNDELRADYVEYHADTQDAVARGNVYFRRGQSEWRGEEVKYNFRSRTGDFGEFNLYEDPYYISARDSKRTAPNVIELRRARVTTCTADQRQEFYIRAGKATITDGSVLRAYNASVWLYGVPMFYVPYWKKDFSRRTHVDIMPGYSSKMGPFLLTGYRTYPTPNWRTSTHLDYRQKRGVGVGQTVRWRYPDVRGRIHAYYADDDMPIRGEGQQRLREGLVDNDRYWLGFQHAQSLGERSSLIAELNYVSDPFVLEDFFDREFRRSVQPENRVALTHRGDNFTAGLLLKPRLNDFYEDVTRLPEASLDVSRVPLGETPLYYESEHRVSRLEKVFPEGADREAYDAFRLDTYHTVLYPTRQFGFLSVVPSIGYRGTWYSDTIGITDTTTNLVPQVDADGELVFDEAGRPVFDEETFTRSSGGGAVLRNLFEFKVETSYKAFKVLSDDQNYLGSGLRHVSEPYARYRWVPEPNVLPDELYQFDAVDQLNKQHDIRIGVRNKLQTRRTRSVIRDPQGLDIEIERDEPVVQQRGGIHDFIDIDTYTILRLDPREDQNDFDDFYFDARVRLTDWWSFDFDGRYDWYESELRQLNTKWSFFAPDRSRLSLEYRFDRDRREMAGAEIVLFPRRRWSYAASWRFDVEEGELEEHSYLIQRELDCTRLGIGVRGRVDEDGDTEWRAWAQVTLLAFPESEMTLGR
jgi:LPS-assembly protein